MPIEVLMPVITEPGDDGVVTAWMVGEGSVVTAGRLIAEVQAEKVAEDVHAPADGVVRDLVAINDPIPQGQPICRIYEPSEAERPDEGAGTGAAAAAAPREPGARVVASPAAKRVARELGIDLAVVAGSGPGGRITEGDVRAVGHGLEASVPPAMTGLRAVIARNMRASAQETAPVTLTSTVNVPEAAPKPITAWIVHVVARSLAEHPLLNGTREGDRFDPAPTAHVAVAVQTVEGLLAPVVRDPASRSIEAVAGEIASLADRARARKLEATDLAGGTFTITNLGGYGIDAFTPIINLPQVAILGVGALRTVPVVDDSGAIVPQRQLTLSLTFDHAFVDGAPAAEFLDHVRRLLEASAE